jgi:hypothetical protein
VALKLKTRSPILLAVVLLGSAVSYGQNVIAGEKTPREFFAECQILLLEKQHLAYGGVPADEKQRKRMQALEQKCSELQRQVNEEQHKPIHRDWRCFQSRCGARVVPIHPNAMY